MQGKQLIPLAERRVWLELQLSLSIRAIKPWLTVLAENLLTNLADKISTTFQTFITHKGNDKRQAGGLNNIMKRVNQALF